METMIQPQQLKKIKTLMGKLKVKDQDVVVLGFSDMRTGHVSELKQQEAVELTRHLLKLDPDEAKAEKMRRKLIGMGYTYYGLGRTASAAEKKAVQQKVKAWVKRYGAAVERVIGQSENTKTGGSITVKGMVHVELNEYTVKELPKLLTQFGKVTREFLEAL